MLLPNRRADLLVKDLGDEVLAFDRSADRVLHLEGTTAAVWRACDGATSVGDCAVTLGIAEDEVLAALRELDDKSLVKLDGLSRRRLLVVAGASLAAAPVLTMIAPPAMAAASTQTGGGTSTGGGTGSATDGTLPGPTITGVNPAQGSSAGGTTVTITGTNFPANPVVTFGQATATIVGTPTASQIVVTSPPKTALQLSNPCQIHVGAVGATSAGLSNGWSYLYV